jgi:hypothetical protein
VKNAIARALLCRQTWIVLNVLQDRLAHQAVVSRLRMTEEVVGPNRNEKDEQCRRDKRPEELEFLRVLRCCAHK